MFSRTIAAVLLACVGVCANAQSLTAAQRTTLKAAITATPAWAAYPQSGDGPTNLAAVLNATASPAFVVWRTDCLVRDIYNQINWAAYTPTDVVSGGDSGDVLTRKSGLLLTIQVKQMNLQVMTQGREVVNTALPNVRGGLRDAVIQVPSGSGGAMTAPGGASGANVLTACLRPATEAEKVLATSSQASDTTGSVTARVMGWEGLLTAEDVRLARL